MTSSFISSDFTSRPSNANAIERGSPTWPQPPTTTTLLLILTPPLCLRFYCKKEIFAIK
jgi:hypothetical protein